MGTKVVTLNITPSQEEDWKILAESTYLALEKVGGDDLTPVSVEECKSSAEGRCRNTPKDGLSNHTSPSGLCFVNGYKDKISRLEDLEKIPICTFVEEVIEQERFKFKVLVVCLRDVTQEHTL